MKVLNASPTDSVDEAVLFSFDAQSMPFQRDLILSMQSGRTNKAEMDYGNNIDLDERHPEGPVLTYGPPGSLDSTQIVCPNVFFVDGQYRMWYTGADDDYRPRTGEPTGTGGRGTQSMAIGRGGFYYGCRAPVHVEIRCGGITRVALVFDRIDDHRPYIEHSVDRASSSTRQWVVYSQHQTARCQNRIERRSP